MRRTSRAGLPTGRAADAPGGAARSIAAWAAASAGTSVAVVVSARLSPGSPLGAPGWWSWLLTGAQIVALWAAGTTHRWGWILGAAVQPPWIAYAVLTGQVGFIPGCAVSAPVQTASFVRSGQARHHGPHTGATVAGAGRLPGGGGRRTGGGRQEM